MTTPSLHPLDELTVDQLRSRTGTKWSRFAPDVIPAWIADADAAVCPAVRSAIVDLLDRGDLTYPHDEAVHSVVDAFVGRQWALHRWAPDPGSVMLVADLVQAMCRVVDAVTQPGDAVMVHTPCYPPFLEQLAELGRPVVSLPFERSATGWATDVDQVRQAAQQGARLVLLVNPHNPTGVVWSAADLEALADVVLEHDLLVMADEIHADLIYGDGRHVPFASLSAEVASRTVTLTSASKSHNIPGARCAVMVVGGHSGWDGLRAIPPASWGQVSNIGMAATLAAWTKGDAWLSAFRSDLEQRRDHFCSVVAAELPMVDLVPPAATMLTWLDMRPLELPGSPAEFFLERARVALGVGEHFGVGGAGRVRVNLATRVDLLDEIVGRMVRAVQQWAERT